MDPDGPSILDEPFDETMSCEYSKPPNSTKHLTDAGTVYPTLLEYHLWGIAPMNLNCLACEGGTNSLRDDKNGGLDVRTEGGRVTSEPCGLSAPGNIRLVDWKRLLIIDPDPEPSRTTAGCNEESADRCDGGNFNLTGQTMTKTRPWVAAWHEAESTNQKAVYLSETPADDTLGRPPPTGGLSPQTVEGAADP
jgi:hypothetical protein